MKKSKKYAFGTGISGVGTAITPGAVVGDVASNFLGNVAIQGLTDIFGSHKNVNPMNSMFTDQTGGVFAMGGVVGGHNVEVEDDEIAEMPNGAIMQFEGATHEAGGIQTNLPAGTTIFSDRIAIDGKTMQERKKARERKLTKLEKKGSGTLDKNTYNRTKKYLDMIESGDLAIQDAAKSAEENTFAYGGVVGNILKGVVDPMNLNLPALATPGIIGDINMPGITPGVGAGPVGDYPGVKTDVPFSAGDITGMIGNAIGGIAPLATTIANRAGDTPNVNSYENFGKDALAANANAKNQLATIKDSALETIGLKENTARARNRNSASSVNTLRALDFATDAVGNEAENDVFANYAQSLMAQFGQQAQLENIQDQVVMGGDQQADLADRQDRDSFYTSLADNFANLGTATQKQAKDMNTHAQNNEIMALLPQLSKYGLGYVYDANGKPILSKI